MKQLELEYPAYNYTETSKSAYIKQKPKLKTKRELVLEFVKSQPSTNYQIADELEMPLSSVCARVHELQECNLVINSGLTRETKYGKQAIVWEIKK